MARKPLTIPKRPSTPQRTETLTMRPVSFPVVPLARTRTTTSGQSSLDDFLATLHNPRWNNAEHTAVLLDGILPSGPTTFLATPTDPEAHGVEVWNKANAGGFGPIGAFTPQPPPLEPIPHIVSSRQFFQALAMSGLITEDEALAAMTGVIPARMNEFIDTLTPSEQFAARMIIKGAGEFDRNHPLTAKFAAHEGLTDQQVLDLWSLAASL